MADSTDPIPLSPQLAIDEFIAIWGRSQPMQDIAASLTCNEVEALADLFYAFNHNAQEYHSIIESHAYNDDCGDMHCRCEECTTPTHLFLINTEEAQKFTDLLISGAGMEEGNPVLTLRERLRRHRSQKIKLSDREAIAMFVVAWNAWRANRRLYKITFRHGLTEENFPVAR